MVSRAEAKYVRISPFKVRQVIRLIKKMPVDKATSYLLALNKKASMVVFKVLRSALANAKNKGYSENSLFVSKIIANSGPMYKRYRAATFGRAVPIRRRTSHILVELDVNENFKR